MLKDFIIHGYINNHASEMIGSLSDIVHEDVRSTSNDGFSVAWAREHTHAHRHTLAYGK